MTTAVKSLSEINLVKCYSCCLTLILSVCFLSGFDNIGDFRDHKPAVRTSFSQKFPNNHKGSLFDFIICSAGEN